MSDQQPPSDESGGTAQITGQVNGTIGITGSATATFDPLPSLPSAAQTVLDALPHIPAQGLHPHFVLNENLEIDLAPPTALDQQGNNVALMRQLLPALSDLSRSVVDLLSRGNRPHPALLAYAGAYADLLRADLEQLDRGRLYVSGLLLSVGDEETRVEIEAGELPTMDVEARTALRSLLRLHGAFILATREGQDAVANADRYESDPIQEEARRADTIAFAEAAREDSRAPDRAFTPQAAEALAATANADGKGPNPARTRAQSLAMLRNASIVITAATVACTIGGVATAPILGASLLSGAATGAAVGFNTVGLLLLVEGIKKWKLFGDTAQEIGKTLDSASDTHRWTDPQSLRHKLTSFSRFTRRVAPVLRRLATRNEQLNWLDGSLDWIDNSSNFPAAEPNEPPVSQNDVGAAPLGFSQDEVQRRILSGEPIPSSWRPFVRKLDFSVDWRPFRQDEESPRDTLEKLWKRRDVPLLRNGNILIQFPNLEDLNVSGCPLEHFRFVFYLKYLKKIDLSYTNIENLEDFKSSTNLLHILFGATKIHDLIPISRLPNLEVIDAGSSKISDIRPLENLPKLHTLNIMATPVLSISAVNNFPSLQVIYVVNTHIPNDHGISSSRDIQIFGNDGMRRPWQPLRGPIPPGRRPPRR